MPLDSAEIALINEAMKGNRNAFEELVTLNQSFVLNLARRFGPKEEMESVAQDTFISAYKGISNLQTPEAFKGWLHSIAIRRCRDSWRVVYKKKAEVSLENFQENSLEQKSVANFSNAVSAENHLQGKMEVESVLSQLSPDDRMIMSLLYLEDKSIKEVSSLMGMTQVNVKVRSHRIKKRLLKFSEKIARRAS